MKKIISILIISLLLIGNTSALKFASKESLETNERYLNWLISSKMQNGENLITKIQEALPENTNYETLKKVREKAIELELNSTNFETKVVLEYITLYTFINGYDEFVSEALKAWNEQNGIQE